MNISKRVVITGIGAVTPLGNTFKETLKGIIEGISGISICKKSDVSKLPWKVVGEVKGFSAEDILTKKEIHRYGLFIQYALKATHEAIKDSNITLPTDTLVVIGSSRGGIYEIENVFDKIYKNIRISAYFMPATTLNMVTSVISQKFRLSSKTLTISSACASGAVAVGEAFEAIKAGICKVAICGGTEAPITRLCLEGYGRMGVLTKKNSKDSSCPFDIHRDGFILSEGACIMILEEMENAISRGASIYAEIKSYANITELKHQTEPLLKAEIQVINKALKNASLNVSDIEHINCHAASTKLGDAIEAEALKRIFGNRIYDIPITAVKSMTGHMLAASSAFEVAITAVSLKNGLIPPTINTKEVEFKLNISSILRKMTINNAISTSFGFGGVNVAILLKKIR